MTPVPEPDQPIDDQPVDSQPVQDGVPEGATCAMHEADAAFVCTRCGDFGCSACLFSAIRGREVCATCASKGLGQAIPWERRKELGNVRAFWQTTKLCLTSPTLFFRTPTTDKNVFAAIAHGALAVSAGLFIAYALLGLLMLLAGGAITALGEPNLGPVGMILGGYGCAMLGLSPFFALIAGPLNAVSGQVFAAMCAHGVLYLAKKNKARFEDTLRVCSYSNAPYFFSFVPVLGSFTWFWVVGIEVIGLRETHQCGTDWAFYAAVGYRVGFIVAIVGGYVALVLGMLLVLPPA